MVNRNLKVSNHWIKHWINHCSFCALCRDAGDPGAYWLSEADLQQKSAEALAAGATELCIQGGLPLDQVLCPEKLTAREWVAALRYAWQHQRLGFTEFVMLPFVGASAPAALRSRMRRDQPVPAAMLLLTAQSRLLLGPWFRFHQPSWVKLTLAGATEALRWGCNHLGRLVRRRTTLYEAVA